MPTVAAALTGDVEAWTVALLSPEGILTVAGVVTTLASELVRCTSMPPSGAGCVSLTVISVEEPPVTRARLSVTFATPTELASAPATRVAAPPEKLPEFVGRDPRPHPAIPKRTAAPAIQSSCARF
jgi:hypothetical protein